MEIERTIEDFKKTLNERLDNWEVFWKESAQNDKYNFPETMEFTDWFDDFALYLETSNE